MKPVVNTRWSFLWVMSLAVLAARAGETAPLVRYHFIQPHMGTQFQITLYAPDERVAAAAAQAAFHRVAELNAILSDYLPDSELMRLCRQAGQGQVPVSKELFAVLRQGQEVSRRSDGAFDVTVGPVVRLWRRARRTQQLPDPKQLAAARALVGYQMVYLDEQTQTVRLEKPGMLLDLGGIAKGYAADESLATLKRHDVDRALVAAGGDIAVSGPPPDAAGWRVGIAPLGDPNQKPSRYLLLSHAAVSTSGDAEQHVEIDGKRYSHIVDPRTGIGLTDRRSATVTAPRGILADSLTKVASILPPDKSFPIIESFPGAAALVVRKASVGEEALASPRFKAIAAEAVPANSQPRRHR